MAGEHSSVFYADNGRIAGRNPIWVQTKLTAVVRMFDRVELIQNLGKTKAMVCTPGFIWGQQRTFFYKRRAMGEGDTFWDRKKTRVICTEYGGEMVVSSLCPHMERTHGRVLPHTREVDVGGGGLEKYVVSFPQVLKLVVFPIDRSLASANNPGRLREQFMYRHWKAKVEIIQEEP